MASDGNGRLGNVTDEADLAKAFQAIAQGEHTATQLENHLTSLESRIDELLKRADENRALVESQANENNSASVDEAKSASSTSNDQDAAK